MKTKLILGAVALAASVSASACDLCACGVPSMWLVPHSGWHAGFAQQFTDYGRLQDSGNGVKNSAGQYIHSSISQVFAGYHFTDWFGLQVNLPYIHRTYRRVEDGIIESGTESGFGDLSLLASFRPLHIERGDFRVTARILAGVKFPTGDSSRLKEEAHHEEGEAEHGEESHHHHEDHDHGESDEIPSGVHGHDLALGSGGFDGILGGDVHLQFKRAYFDAGLQATIRGSGRHSYDHADDLMWFAGAGAIIVENSDWNVGLGVRFSGETKGEDKFRGNRLSDTSVNTVYVGPQFALTWKEKLSANLGLEFPIARANSSIQLVPERRLQATMSWQF